MNSRPVLRKNVAQISAPASAQATPKPVQRALAETAPVKVKFIKARRNRCEVPTFFARLPGYPTDGFQPVVGRTYWVVGTLHKHGSCYWLTEVAEPETQTN